MKGFQKFKSKDFKGVLKEFKKVIKKHPEEPFSYYYKALVEIELNKTEEACKDLLKSKKLGFLLKKNSLQQFDCPIIE